MNNWHVEKTNRGFEIIRFEDIYNVECSIQQSSLASYDALWVGAHELRMHINKEMAIEIIEILQRWINTNHLKKCKSLLNKKAEFTIKLLKQYADDSGVIAHSTSDISPLENYVLTMLYNFVNKKDNIETIDDDVDYSAFKSMLLHKYAQFYEIAPRANFDTSRMEDWLIYKLFKYITGREKYED